ncbi:hypothetical protein CEXT_303471 [Caerostris extrusa]|uniref:Uncharacterized protein n=1 Tax=Caerostris extrusa TaxID=172846 RepID=A0AAV4T8D5_CAEEX|nr:hypothetical protein CEXT_303471 [Caerostris extrusa]
METALVNLKSSSISHYRLLKVAHSSPNENFNKTQSCLQNSLAHKFLRLPQIVEEEKSSPLVSREPCTTRIVWNGCCNLPRADDN